jgi:hypothetical protein
VGSGLEWRRVAFGGGHCYKRCSVFGLCLQSHLVAAAATTLACIPSCRFKAAHTSSFDKISAHSLHENCYFYAEDRISFTYKKLCCDLKIY